VHAVTCPIARDQGLIDQVAACPISARWRATRDGGEHQGLSDIVRERSVLRQLITVGNAS